jgi:hypothetical protein
MSLRLEILLHILSVSCSLQVIPWEYFGPFETLVITFFIAFTACHKSFWFVVKYVSFINLLIDYVLAKDTFYVESFDNGINIFQDKRISFSDEQYKFRSNLAVLHWNEN